MEIGLFWIIFILCVGAILVWLSGTQLAIYADWISHRFKVGPAFIGALLLAFATSLPELTTTITTSAIGNAPLAVNNLLGGINLQTVILAVVDLVLVRGALTYFSPKPALLIGGLFVIVQLAIVLIGIATHNYFSYYQVGIFPLIVFILYLGMLYFISSHERDVKWEAVGKTPKKRISRIPAPTSKKYSNFRLFSLFLMNTIIVSLSGWSVGFFSDMLAKRFALSSGWIGATLLSFITSLPEISTTFGAVRQRAYVLAVANIFGSNSLTIALLFFADLFFRKGMILNAVDPSSTILGGLGILLTTLFLWGILDRNNRTFLRMGIDSCFALLVYLIGLVLVYFATL